MNASWPAKPAAVMTAAGRSAHGPSRRGPIVATTSGRGDRTSSETFFEFAETHRRYDEVVVAWSYEQAASLRSGHLYEIEVEHHADKIGDLGKSARKELASHVAVLLAYNLN